MKNKIISILLIFSLILPTFSTDAMEKMAPSRHSNYGYVQRSTCALITTCVAALCSTGAFFAGNLFGYKHGQKDKLNRLKNIKLTGVASIFGDDVPSGRIKPIPLAKEYIKDILRNELPKLSQENEFPLCKLVAVEHYLAIIEGSGESEELSRGLVTLSKRMLNFITTKSEITLGTLMDMLNDAKELVDRAYKEIYVDKKQKEL